MNIEGLVSFIAGCIHECEAEGFATLETVETGQVPDGATPDEWGTTNTTLWFRFGERRFVVSVRETKRARGGGA